MEPVGSSAGGFGSGLAGLGTRQSAKNKCVDTVYACGAFYKKPKKSVAGVSIESSTGPLCLEDLGSDNGKLAVSWGSRVGSISGSVSGFSDVKNLENLIAEETSYIDSGEDDKMDETTPCRTCIQTYVLKQPLKAPLFATMNNDNNDSVLPPPKINESNQLPSSKSCVLKSHNFGPVKLFALDVNLLAVPGKTNGNKLVSIKKNFYHVDGFGGAFTPSKFPGIIRSTFTSEASINKAKSLAVSEKILVNDELRKVHSHSNREIMVKKIPVDLPKLAVESVFSKFVEFKLAEIAGMVTSKWSVFMSKDSMQVALTTEDKLSWTLLYILPVGTMAHDLSDLLEFYDGKTYFIGRNPVSYICDRCAIVCFDDKAVKLAAVSTIPIFKGVSLHWASLVLTSCAKCKQLGHIHADCSVGGSSGARGKRVVSDQNQIRLAGIYKKKSAPIACPVLFGGKIWAQVAGGTPSYVFLSGSSGYDLHSGLVPPSVISDPLVVSCLSNRLAILEHSLELLANRVEFLWCGFLAPSSLVSPFVVSAALGSEVDSDMIVDNALSSSSITPPVTDDAVVNLSASGSKVLTAKVGGLETKLVALEASVGSVLDKLNLLCSGLGVDMNNCAKQTDIVHWHKDINNLVSIVTETKLKRKIHPWIANRFNGVRVFTSGLDSGYMGSGVAIILNSLLVRYVCKILEVPGWLLSVRLLFKNKLFVSILELYTGASLVIHFFQAGNINFFIAKVMNKSFFVILGGDFNENDSHKCASFNKCFDLGLVNSLSGSSFVKSPTWYNFHGVAKTIDYVFISSNLINAVVDHSIAGVNEFFDTDHKAVSVSVSIGELLDVQLSSLCKQANRDHWKFDIKCASKVKWLEFKNAMADNASMFSDAFVMARKFSDMDEMWNVSFNSVFNKILSRFHKLELLVSKLVKNSCLVSSGDFALLLETWDKLDSSGASVVKSLFLSDSGFDPIHSTLAKARKLYCASKLLESKCAEESLIKQAISKRMKSFELDKGHTIRSVLEHPFCKVVLNHLVVRDKLVLEPDSVKLKVDEIMEGWTRKYRVVSDISGDWVCQYWPLEHVFNGAFSGVMCLISFDKMSAVVKDLSDGKVAGLSGIFNELWKCCDKSVLDMFLVLLNLCLVSESIFELWREVWEGVLTNTCSIALIETACKILSKILSDRISLACSAFDVLRGDNFSVLKSISTQSPIFAVDSVIEDALKKNRELWLCIFYDSLLCEIKRQDSVYGYRLNSHFISKTGWADPQAGLSLFLAAGAFVDNTIWVGSSQAATQHILDVAILSWRPRHPLLFPSHIGVNPSNNFLAGVRLDLCGPISFWFDLSICFLGGVVLLSSSSSLLDGYAVSDVCLFYDFGVVCDTLLTVDAARLSVYTDKSLFSLDTIDMKADAAVFFEDIDLGLGVGVSGLVSSTMTELQAIALALECVPSSHLIDLFLDSQATLDVCRLESLLIHPDLRNCCWIEHRHIATIIHQKNLDVNWVKVKGHLGVSGNKHADALAKNAALSAWHLPHLVSKHFLCAGGAAVFDNSRHFVHDVFRSVNRACWEVGVGSCVVAASLRANINWFKSSLVWHTDFYLASSFTSMRMLPVAVRKRLYDRRYPSVICLFCGDVEISDHIFPCPHDATDYARLLDAHVSAWEALSGLFRFSSCVLQMLASCISKVRIGVVLCKSFVFDNWFHKFVSVFKDSKEGTKRIVSFVHEFYLAFWDDIWLVCAKYWAFMKRRGLIPRDGSIPVSIFSLFSVFLAGVIRLLDVAKAFGVSFGFHKLCLFFSGIGDTVSVHIGV
ncbi:hypothetical protein G9A89_003743 [Geosiphon pyriformis]|nr:hypothetical protein G9A89_003743 [Geosiphon pyriformis]